MGRAGVREECTGGGRHECSTLVKAMVVCVVGGVGDEKLQLGRQEQIGAAVDVHRRDAVFNHRHHNHWSVSHFVSVSSLITSPRMSIVSAANLSSHDNKARAKNNNKKAVLSQKMTARCALYMSVSYVSSQNRTRVKLNSVFFVRFSVSPKFPHVPLGVGGWPLGYEERRCWANCP